MLTIQEVGLSIMGDTPKNLYFLGGTEYGVKEKYIEFLEDKFGPRMEYTTVLDLISLMTSYHIIPLQPRVYVIRYDKVFLSKMNKEVANTLLNLNIVGAAVVLYEDDKEIYKVDKLFPDNTAIINGIDDKHMAKYLKKDFPELDKNTITSIAKNAVNYYQAKSIGRCLNCVRDTITLTEPEICSLFGLVNSSTTIAIQEAIASRNYIEFLHLIDTFDGDLNSILYLIMNTMTELDKVLDNKYANSPVKKFADKWTRPDVYYMFNHTYNALESIRSGAIVNIYDMLVYLGALLKFKNIPDLEVLAG